MVKDWLKKFVTDKRPRVFDPRRNEDFVFGPSEDGVRVSSLKEALLVVLLPPSYTILSSTSNSVRQIILEELGSRAGVGFVCAFAVPNEVTSLLPTPWATSGESGLSYFPSSREAFAKYNNILELLRYGGLTIGCCAEKFESSPDPKGKQCYDDLYVVTRAKQLQRFVSFYADTGHAYFVTRIHKGTDQFLSRVLSAPHDKSPAH